MSEQLIDAGFYTPTLTNVTNVASSTASECRWMRIGNIVTVCGQVTIDPTAAAPTATELGMSLPIPSLISNTRQLSGVGAVGGVQQSCAIYGDPTNDRAAFQFSAVDAASRLWAFIFTYQLLQT